jgi:hypothetical protein
VGDGWAVECPRNLNSCFADGDSQQGHPSAVTHMTTGNRRLLWAASVIIAFVLGFLLRRRGQECPSLGAGDGSVVGNSGGSPPGGPSRVRVKGKNDGGGANSRGQVEKEPDRHRRDAKSVQDADSKVKATCSHLRDESVNGEPAAVWRIHSTSDFDTSDSDLWISRRSGLLLKSDVHQDVGGSLGKSHIVSRYEYANVRPPAGVQ